MGRLIDEHEVLHPGGDVAVELHDRHVPDELTARRRFEERGEAFERVRRPERVVLAIRCEHLEPAVLHELTREEHVPAAQRVKLHEVGHLVGHPGPPGAVVAHS